MYKYIRGIQTTNPNLTDIEAISKIGFLNKETDPKAKSNLELWIYSNDPGQIPHMHVHIEGERDACIRFDSAEYFVHGFNDNKVSSKVAGWIDSLLRKPYKYGIDYWQHAKDLWNENNSDVEIPEDMEQPDYTKLNK